MSGTCELRRDPQFRGRMGQGGSPVWSGVLRSAVPPVWLGSAAQAGRKRARYCCRPVLGVVWFSMLVGLGLVAPVGWAAGTGSIGGVVQQQGQGIADHRIMLIRFGPDREVQRTPGQTDAQGQFVFTQLDTDQAFEYFVGIRYAGRLYRSEPIRLQKGQPRTGIVVQVGPSVSQTEPGVTSPFLHITNHMKVIVWRQDRLEVREIIGMVQPDTASGQVSSSGTAAVSLHLPLPPGYTNLGNVQGLAPEHVRLSATGLSYAAPLDPGPHRIIYTYVLPLRGKVSTLLLERTLPTAILDVLVEDAHLAATSDLESRGRVSIEPHTFFHFRGTNLASHTRSWLQLTRKSAGMPFLRAVTYGLIIAVILVAVGLPLTGAWRRQTPANGVAPLVDMQTLYATRLQVLQTIVRLDDQHGTGALEEGEYRQRRQGYKQQLLEVAEQLQQAQPDREDGH